ncbi:hypothetical protein [Streptomyces aureus]|uniref:Uncharacterized protein n=1 Tax=Streptomyces aureus TaxID=193461 RepID=A0ABV4SQ50_9ACTN
MAKPVRASLGEMWITCQVCRSELFRERGIKLNSTGMVHEAGVGGRDGDGPDLLEVRIRAPLREP